MRHFCFLIYRFLCEIFRHLFFSKRTTYLAGIFQSDTGVITRARFPTGRAVVMCVEWKAEVPALARSRFVFFRLVGRHFKRNKKYVLKRLNQGKLKTRKNNEKYLSCQNGTFTE